MMVIIVSSEKIIYWLILPLLIFVYHHSIVILPQEILKLCTTITTHEVLEMACIYIYKVIRLKTQNMHSNLYTAFMEISFDCPTYSFDTYTSRPLLDLPLTFCRHLCLWRPPGF